MTILDIISQLWDKEKLPIINGLVKEDGSFYDIEIGEYCYPVKNDYKPKKIDLSLKNYLECFSHIYILQQLTHFEITYYCGEGSHGSDGWLLALDSNNELKWLFFSQEANPFEKLWIENNEIHVMNNLNIEWIFPINSPEKVYYVKHEF
jgi:hypothetical protein